MPVTQAELLAAANNETLPALEKLTDAEREKLRGDEGLPAGTPPPEGDAPVTDEVATPAPDGEEAPAGRRENFVPQSRVNEIVERNARRTETLQSRIAELEKQVQKGEQDLNFAEVEKEIDGLEAQFSELLLTGKGQEAAALRKTIRGIERRLMATQSAYHADARSTRAVEELRTDAVIDDLEASYTFLDPSHADYQKEIVEEILTYQRGFVASGHRGDMAMSMAAQYVLSQLELEPEGGGESAGTGADVVEEKPDGEGLRRADLAGKALLAARLPPQMRGGRPGTPQATTAKQLSDLGQVGFDKIRGRLSEDDLAKARGDTV